MHLPHHLDIYIGFNPNSPWSRIGEAKRARRQAQRGSNQYISALLLRLIRRTISGTGAIPFVLIVPRSSS